MKGKTTRNIFLFLLAVGILICIAGLAMANFDPARLQTGGPFSLQSFSTTEKVTSLSIDVNEAEVRLVRAEEDVSEFSVSYEENAVVKFVPEYKEGVFSLTSVEVEWYRRFFSLTFKTPLVTVRLPEESYEHFSVKTRNGALSSESELSAKSAYLATSNGKISVRNLTLTGNLTAESSNGAMLLSNISASSITAKTSNGKFETDLLTAADIYLKTSNGKIDAQTLLAANSIVLKTSNGAMLLSNISASSITAKTSNGKFETDLLTAADIYLKTSNGKIDAQTLLAANSIVLKTSNGAINATVVGTAEDFRIDASTSNGSNNLADTAAGDKALTVRTSNGNISVFFLG